CSIGESLGVWTATLRESPDERRGLYAEKVQWEADSLLSLKRTVRVLNSVYKEGAIGKKIEKLNQIIADAEQRLTV
ncbi:MAG: hypothetical protein WCA46_10080, partial [Actinocatenispora sp.]